MHFSDYIPADSIDLDLGMGPWSTPTSSSRIESLGPSLKEAARFRHNWQAPTPSEERAALIQAQKDKYMDYGIGESVAGPLSYVDHIRRVSEGKRPVYNDGVNSVRANVWGTPLIEYSRKF